MHDPRSRLQCPPGRGSRGRTVLVLSASGASATDHPERGIGDHPKLDLARGLLGTDQDDAEAPAPLGDVEQHLLDGRPAAPRRVAVQLVQHGEHQRLGRPPRFLVLEHPLEHHADDETLGLIVQVVKVDDADLSRGPVDPMPSGLLLVRAPDEVGRLGPSPPRADGGRTTWCQEPKPPPTLEMVRDDLPQLLGARRRVGSAVSTAPGLSGSVGARWRRARLAPLQQKADCDVSSSASANRT